MRRKRNLGVDDHKTSVVGVACGQELKKEGELLKKESPSQRSSSSRTVVSTRSLTLKVLEIL